MELSDEEHRALTSGGDCNLHSHGSDRVVTHDNVLQYQDMERIGKLTASYTATYADDYLFVDSTIAPVTITLPIARGGKFYCVVRVAGGNSITLSPNGVDKINGATSLVVSTSYSPVRLKALKGTGWVQV